MKRLTIILIISLQYLAAQNLLIDTFDFDGFSRNYQLYIPDIYDGSQAVPLVINLHGYGSNAGQQNFYGSFDALADVDNFLVVHPNGTLDQTNTQYWNAFGNSGGVDDVAFISALIDTLNLSYNIDLTQVFATGMSNGGFMSYKLACELDDRIAKIASVTGTMPLNLQNSCSPNSGIPVLQIHGTSDATVPYNGSAAFQGIEDVIDFWVSTNNCDTPAVFTPLPDINTSDNSTVERYEYFNGDDNSEVIFYKVIDGGHTWPGAIFDIPGSNTNKDFNASQTIWEFFKGSTFVGIEDLLNHPNFSLVRSGNSLKLTNKEDGEILRLKVVDMLGKECIVSQENFIEIQSLRSGIYFLIAETDHGIFSASFLK